MKKLVLCLIMVGLLIGGMPLISSAASVAYLNNYITSYWTYPAYNLPQFYADMSNVDSIDLISVAPGGSAPGVTYYSSLSASNLYGYDVVVVDAWTNYTYPNAVVSALIQYLNNGGKLIITGKACFYLSGAGITSLPDFPLSIVGGFAASTSCYLYQLDPEHSDMTHPLLNGIDTASYYNNFSTYSYATLLGSVLSSGSTVVGNFNYYGLLMAIIVNPTKNTIIINSIGHTDSCGDTGKSTVYSNAIGFLVKSDPITNVGSAFSVVTNDSGIGGIASTIIEVDDDPSDGNIGASVGSKVYAYGLGESPFTDIAESKAEGPITFSVPEPKQLYLHVSVGGVYGGYQIFNSQVYISAAIKDESDNILAQFSGVNANVSIVPSAGFYQVDKKESIGYWAEPGVEYTLNFMQHLKASATGSGSSGYANFQGSSTVIVSDKELSEHPQANAGDDQICNIGETAVLDGSESSDPDGKDLNYSWKQVGGPAVSLIDPNSVSSSFFASEAGLYRFELVVDNGELKSLPDYCNVIVKSIVQDLEVAIDIKPGSDDNPINLCSNGVLPIAILGAADFDVNNIVVDSIELAGSGVAIRGKNKSMASIKLINGDDYPDLIIHIEVENLNLVEGDIEVTLTGELFDQTPFSGTDIVQIVRSECNN